MLGVMVEIPFINIYINNISETFMYAETLKASVLSFIKKYLIVKGYEKKSLAFACYICLLCNNGEFSAPEKID